MPTNKAKQGKGTEVSRIGCHPPITHGPGGAGLKEGCSSNAKSGDQGAVAVYASGLTGGGISWSVYRRISQTVWARSHRTSF